jgi:hypothetical protein
VAILLEFVGAIVVVALLVRGLLSFLSDHRRRRGQ